MDRSKTVRFYPRQASRPREMRLHAGAAARHARAAAARVRSECCRLAQWWFPASLSLVEWSGVEWSEAAWAVPERSDRARANPPRGSVWTRAGPEVCPERAYRVLRAFAFRWWQPAHSG